MLSFFTSYPFLSFLSSPLFPLFSFFTDVLTSLYLPPLLSLHPPLSFPSVSRLVHMMFLTLSISSSVVSSSSSFLSLYPNRSQIKTLILHIYQLYYHYCQSFYFFLFFSTSFSTFSSCFFLLFMLTCLFFCQNFVDYVHSVVSSVIPLLPLCSLLLYSPLSSVTSIC